MKRGWGGAEYMYTGMYTLNVSFKKKNVASKYGHHIELLTVLASGWASADQQLMGHWDWLTLDRPPSLQPFCLGSVHLTVRIFNPHPIHVFIEREREL